jgi:enolase
MKIKDIKAIEILDSRGNPTVETKVVLEDGSEGVSSVPSGASTGAHEAVELRDEDKTRYMGKGVLKAVENVNTRIKKLLIGQDATSQEEIDHKMIEADGTDNKDELGANAILSVSMASAKAASQSVKKPLFEYLSKLNPDAGSKFKMPVPMMNIMNGGKHGNWASDIQEYMILPIGAPSITEAVRYCAEVYHHLKKIIKNKGYSTAVGDEGGYAPQFKTNEEPFELMMEAIESAGYKPREDFGLGIDAAASEFFEEEKYFLKKEEKYLSSSELSGFYLELTKKYPIISMEDIFNEDDWDGFTEFYQRTDGRIQIVGDDLYVTNVKRLERGIKMGASNSILIKLNQIGTITETVNAILKARENGMSSVVSHRSGETEDAFISDFVVAMGTGQIKTGAPARGERTAKYNQLIRIEKYLGSKAEYSAFPF